MWGWCGTHARRFFVVFFSIKTNQWFCNWHVLECDNSMRFIANMEIFNLLFEELQVSKCGIPNEGLIGFMLTEHQIHTCIFFRWGSHSTRWCDDIRYCCYNPLAVYIPKTQSISTPCQLFLKTNQVKKSSVFVMYIHMFFPMPYIWAMSQDVWRTVQPCGFGCPIGDRRLPKPTFWMSEFLPLWKVRNPTTFWNSQKAMKQTVMCHKWYAQLITYEFEKTRNPDSQTFASRFWRIRFVVTGSTPWWRSLPLRDFLLPRRSCSWSIRWVVDAEKSCHHFWCLGIFDDFCCCIVFSKIRTCPKLRFFWAF